MTEQFLRDLGLPDSCIRAILEQVQNRESEWQAVVEGIHQAHRTAQIAELAAQSGIKEGVIRRAVEEELAELGDDRAAMTERLEQLRADQPELFEPIAPYFAAALQDGEHEERGDAPFHWIRPREGRGA